jgi:hypothetical protein
MEEIFVLQENQNVRNARSLNIVLRRISRNYGNISFELWIIKENKNSKLKLKGIIL